MMNEPKVLRAKCHYTRECAKPPDIQMAKGHTQFIISRLLTEEIEWNEGVYCIITSQKDIPPSTFDWEDGEIRSKMLVYELQQVLSAIEGQIIDMKTSGHEQQVALPTIQDAIAFLETAGVRKIVECNA